MWIGALSLDYAILGFLSQAPASGYDLKRRCFDGGALDSSAGIAAFWPADQAQIYRTLERLRRAELVSETRGRVGRRPERRVFAITTAGSRELISWLESPENMSVNRDSFALKLHFSDALSAQARHELLASQLAQRRARHGWLREQVAALERDKSLTARARKARVGALAGVVAQEAGLIQSLEQQLSDIEEGDGMQRGMGGAAA